MNLFQACVILIFLVTNIWIVYIDICTRTIPNVLVLLLIAILPIWYLVFPLGNPIQIVTGFLLSLILLGFGAFAYEKNGFLGSGDIKYAAILILYLWIHPLPIWIGNLWAITLVALICWMMMILGQIIAMKSHIHRIDFERAWGTISGHQIVSWFQNWILDWAIIGFFFALILKHIYTLVFDAMPTDTDFYFFLTLTVFLVRPYIKYILTQSSYGVVVGFMVFLYFWYAAQQHGIDTFSREYLWYLSNVWQYALILVLLQKNTNIIFRIYDGIIVKTKTHNSLQTIPYSLLLCIAFIVTYCSDMNLMSSIKFILWY